LPFVLEAADYSWLGAFRPGRRRSADDVLPSDLFRQHVFVTYWFERQAPRHFLDLIPVDNVLFETDFPHTTCLFGDIDQTIEENLGHLPEDVRRKILWENASQLYRIESPPADWPGFGP
jgi:predicted TIM-barrel fold metal-dependent hydrolase